MSKHYNHLSTVLKTKAEWIWKRQKVVEKENGWNRIAIQSILVLYKHMNIYNDDSKKLNKLKKKKTSWFFCSIEWIVLSENT